MKKTGAKNFAMRMFEMSPKGHTPRHKHDWEHEVFILEGKGLVYGGGVERRFNQGHFIFIPPGEEHQLVNAGKNTVKFLCMIPYVSKNKGLTR